MSDDLLGKGGESRDTAGGRLRPRRGSRLSRGFARARRVQADERRARRRHGSAAAHHRAGATREKLSAYSPSAVLNAETSVYL